MQRIVRLQMTSRSLSRIVPQRVLLDDICTTSSPPPSNSNVACNTLQAVRVAAAQSMPQVQEALDAMMTRTHDVSPEVGHWEVRSRA